MAKIEEKVDFVFEVLMSKYGSSNILAKFDGLEIARVKEIWARDLGRYTSHQLGYALDCLNANNFPPSLPEFLGYCERGKQVLPAPAQRLALKKYDPNDPAVIEARDRCNADMRAMYSGQQRANRAWAYRAVRNHESKSPELTPEELQVAQDCIALDRGADDPFKIVEQAA